MKRSNNRLLVFICLCCFPVFIITGYSCKNRFHHYGNSGYDLSHPDQIIELPEILREVSDIVLLDSATIACVQDEDGILFIYDLTTKRIKKQKVFFDNGDYEGICKVDTSIYILRSDGALFEIVDYSSDKLHVIPYPTQIQGSNNEGLCYDKKNNRLLIARKNKLGKGKEFKNKRVIYEFDLKTKQLNNNPVFEFDLDTVLELAGEKKIDLPSKNKAKGKKPPTPVLRFASSALAIHPVTEKIFLISSLDYLLFVINNEGKIELMDKLDPQLFIKSEGITFNTAGDMFISNEGKDKKATLLRFNYHHR